MENSLTENWDWADEIISGCDFEAVDCEYDAETNEHKYFDQDENCAIVLPNGTVIIK